MARDLRQKSQFFEASARLETASSELFRLSGEQDLGTDAKEALTWAGNFLMRVSKGVPPGEVGGGLAVQATSVRPTFYSTLKKIDYLFEEEGLRSPQEKGAFLSEMLTLLVDGGSSTSMPSNKIVLAAKLLHELSRGLLHQTGWTYRNRPRTSAPNSDLAL